MSTSKFFQRLTKLHEPVGEYNLWSLKKCTSAYLFQIAREKSCDYLLIIFMKKLRDRESARVKYVQKNLFKYHHTCSQNNIFLDFFKVESRRNGLNSSWTVQSVWIKDSGLLPPSFALFQRIFCPTSDTCRALFGHLPRTASQAKLFLFVLQHLFGRTKFSVTFIGQGAFVL